MGEEMVFTVEGDKAAAARPISLAEAGLAEVLTNETIITMLDICASRPGEWVPFSDITEAVALPVAKTRGATGGFTFTVRKHFMRSNWPLESSWKVGDRSQKHWRLTADQAAWWLSARGAASGAGGSDSIERECRNPASE